jgi:hypothetical protein
MLRVIRVSEYCLGVTLRVGIRAFTGVLLATLDIGLGFGITSCEYVLTLCGVTLLFFRVLGTTDNPVFAALLGNIGEHILFTVRNLAPFSNKMVNTALGISFTLFVILRLSLAWIRVRLTLFRISSTTHLMINMSRVPVYILITAFSSVLFTTDFMVFSGNGFPSLLAALAFISRHVTA